MYSQKKEKSGTVDVELVKPEQRIPADELECRTHIPKLSTRTPKDYSKSSPLVNDLEVGTPQWFNKAHEVIEYTERELPEWKRIMGEELLKKKAEVGHGNWLKWIEDNLSFSWSTAKRYMAEANSSQMSYLDSEPEPLLRPTLEISVKKEDVHVNTATPVYVVPAASEVIAEKAKERIAIRTPRAEQERVPIQIPKRLHEVAKKEAESFGISLPKYLEQIVIEHLEALAE